MLGDIRLWWWLAGGVGGNVMGPGSVREARTGSDPEMARSTNTVSKPQWRTGSMKMSDQKYSLNAPTTEEIPSIASPDSTFSMMTTAG